MAPRRGSGSSDPPSPGDTVLMTVTLDEPSPEAAARALGVPASAIDRDFGVVALDPERALYAVKIPQAAVPPAQRGPYRGPFSDPPIAVPPRKRDERC